MLVCYFFPPLLFSNFITEQTDEFDDDLDQFRRPLRDHSFRQGQYPIQNPECMWNWSNSPRSIHGSSEGIEDDLRSSWDDEIGPLQVGGQIQPYHMNGHIPNTYIHEPGFQAIPSHSPQQVVRHRVVTWLDKMKLSPSFPQLTHAFSSSLCSNPSSCK